MGKPDGGFEVFPKPEKLRRAEDLLRRASERREEEVRQLRRAEDLLRRARERREEEVRQEEVRQELRVKIAAGVEKAKIVFGQDPLRTIAARIRAREFG